MERYRLLVRNSVAKDFSPLPKKDARRLVQAIASLADDPRPPQARKLSGAENYRLRCGVYRIIYEIDDQQLLVRVARVRHRKDVYR